MITELFTEPPDFIEIEKELQADPWLQTKTVSFKDRVVIFFKELAQSAQFFQLAQHINNSVSSRVRILDKFRDFKPQFLSSNKSIRWKLERNILQHQQSNTVCYCSNRRSCWYRNDNERFMQIIRILPSSMLIIVEKHTRLIAGVTEMFSRRLSIKSSRSFFSFTGCKQR